jgi:hypothetical protein
MGAAIGVAAVIPVILIVCLLCSPCYIVSSCCMWSQLKKIKEKFKSPHILDRKIHPLLISILSCLFVLFVLFYINFDITLYNKNVKALMNKL